jgi:Tfp pilus assembly protein PilN
MAQQVNLCLPILRKQKTSFTAQTLALALAILLLVGGALGAVWVWNLNQASASLKATLATQTQELDGLRAALAKSQGVVAPGQTAAEQALTQGRAHLLQREKILAALQQGHIQPGFGHAARLQLVAQTIPSAAWISQIIADERTLEVSGYTLEPAVLTTWVNRLAQSPLLNGQSLSTVKVESVKPDTVLPGAVAVGQVVPPPVAALPAQASSQPPRPTLPAIWSYALLSSMASSVAAPKAKP